MDKPEVLSIKTFLKRETITAVFSRRVGKL
jgi:hypothetical protein